MQQAFQTALRPSRAGCIIVVLLHAAAVWLCLTAFYGLMRWAGLLLLVISLVWAWRVQTMQQAGAVFKIAVNREGRAVVFVGDSQTAFAARLAAGSLIARRALFLKWDLGDRIIRHCVLPDMTDSESYRRLAVWAKWGQPKN
ncbi:protein YgfX [Uruburuella testudinis]